MRALSFLLLAALLLVLHASPASADARTFTCSDGTEVTIVVLGKNTIRAENIGGQTMKLRQSKTEQWFFLNGDYGVRIAPDQLSMQIQIPDWGVGKCVAKGAGPAPKVTTKCPAGQVYDRMRTRCSPACPQGEVSIGGTCCPPTFTSTDGKHCCPWGQIWLGKRCGAAAEQFRCDQATTACNSTGEPAACQAAARCEE